MKKIILTTLSFLLLMSTAFNAAAALASDASIKELVQLMRSEQVIDPTKAQLKLQIAQVAKQALKNRKPNKLEQQAIDKMYKNILTAFDEEMSKEKISEMNIRLYKASFSEEEISGMLRFYKTSTGQAVINKLPLVTSNLMQEVQKMMDRYMPKLQKIGEEFDKEFLAASS